MPCLTLVVCGGHPAPVPYACDTPTVFQHGELLLTIRFVGEAIVPVLQWIANRDLMHTTGPNRGVKVFATAHRTAPLSIRVHVVCSILQPALHPRVSPRLLVHGVLAGPLYISVAGLPIKGDRGAIHRREGDFVDLALGSIVSHSVRSRKPALLGDPWRIGDSGKIQ